MNLFGEASRHRCYSFLSKNYWCSIDPGNWKLELSLQGGGSLHGYNLYCPDSSKECSHEANSCVSQSVTHQTHSYNFSCAWMASLSPIDVIFVTNITS